MYNVVYSPHRSVGVRGACCLHVVAIHVSNKIDLMLCRSLACKMFGDGKTNRLARLMNVRRKDSVLRAIEFAAATAAVPPCIAIAPQAAAFALRP